MEPWALLHFPRLFRCDCPAASLMSLSKRPRGPHRRSWGPRACFFYKYTWPVSVPFVGGSTLKGCSASSFIFEGLHASAGTRFASFHSSIPSINFKLYTTEQRPIVASRQFFISS